MNPLWNPANKSASIRQWAEHLHEESKRVFLKDKTHAHLIFLFKDEGPVSISPVPPKTDNEQIHRGIIQAVKQHNLYAVISIGEAWTYIRKDKKDHTAFQILDGEIKVSELKDEDKLEALYLRMENRDGDCTVYWDRILRAGENVSFGEAKILNNEESKWF